MRYLLWHDLKSNAEKYPQKTAVVYNDTQLSYSELDNLSTQLARFLLQINIKRQSRVAFFMPKSEKNVVTMFGILKSCACYVPIDPHAPIERAKYILNNCAVSALVTTKELYKKLAPHLSEISSLQYLIITDVDDDKPLHDDTIHLVAWSDLMTMQSDDHSFDSVLETDPAYILYTSGSTGKPKGVILSHRHALTFVDWGADAFSVNSDDRLSNHAPHHFDLSVFDIYVAISRGASVHLVPEQTALFPVRLTEWIHEQKISVWYSVPSALTRLLLQGKIEKYDYPHLRVVLYAGEIFPVKYLRQVMTKLQSATFYNLYGPTETNVCTYYELPKKLNDDVNDIPIGKACENTEVFAVTDENKIAGVGDTGELFVRGPTVLLGYWALPEKTNETVNPNQFQQAYPENIYRTGDIVKLENDGNYRFIGRRDHMVKSRGYRIELGEIEQVLYSHVHVKEAIVVAIPDEKISHILKAIIVPNHDDSEMDSVDFRAYCLQILPMYMVPEEFVFYKELPRTSTGKIDRVKMLALFDKE